MNKPSSGSVGAREGFLEEVTHEQRPMRGYLQPRGRTACARAQRDGNPGVHKVLWSRRALGKGRGGEREAEGGRTNQGLICRLRIWNLAPRSARSFLRLVVQSKHDQLCVLEEGLDAQWREGRGWGENSGRKDPGIWPVVRVLHPVSPSGPQTPSQPLSPWSGAGVRQWGRGCWANYKSLPSLNLSFHPCPGGLTGDGRVGAAGPGCKLLPARRDRREARGCPAPFVPGLGWGAFASPRAPSQASLGPTLAQGSSLSLTPWVSGGSGPASGCLRPSCPGSPSPHLAWHLPSLGQGAPHPALPLPEPVPPAVALHLQSLAGCCPQQAGQAGQGSRKTLGPESDTPAG